MRLPILQLSCRHFWQIITSPRSVSPLEPRFGSLRLLDFPKAKIVVEREEICDCDGQTVQKLSQRRLTADWLAPRDSDCSWMHSKVSSDWLSSYIKATRPVFEIFKMVWYFPDSPRIPNSMEHNPSWEASEQIPRISRNPKIHHPHLHIYKVQPSVPVIRQNNPIRTPSYFSKIPFNIIFPSTPRSSKSSLSTGFLTKVLYAPLWSLIRAKLPAYLIVF